MTLQVVRAGQDDSASAPILLAEPGMPGLPRVTANCVCVQEGAVCAEKNGLKYIHHGRIMSDFFFFVVAEFSKFSTINRGKERGSQGW